jgi:hypothetical protein
MKAIPPRKAFLMAKITKTAGAITHAALCDIAVNWLKRPPSRGGPGCQVAFSESRRGYLTGEIPDAIGFRAGVHDECSVLVECKVSRNDFLADMKKVHRINEGQGMGTYRYYLAPTGLISPNELPAKWGLVEVNERGVPNVLAGLAKHKGWGKPYQDWKHEHDIEAERSLLARLLYRVGDVDRMHKSLKAAESKASKFAADYQWLQKEFQSLEKAASAVILQLPEHVREQFGKLRRGELLPKDISNNLVAIPRKKQGRNE